MLKVERQSFDDLSDTEKAGASDNGGGRDYANYVRVSHDGKTLYLESDAMEPEDSRFTRDLSWVLDAIRRAYELGIADGSRRHP